MTGLVDALMDSSRSLPDRPGADAPDRQRRLQEADTTGITRPATKHSYLVKRARTWRAWCTQTFYVARSGRPGQWWWICRDIVIGKAPYAPPAVSHELSPRTG